MAKFFDQTEDSLPILLLRARETLMVQLRPTLAKHDITEQQWRVLRVLHEAGPSEPTPLGEACALLTPSLTRILRVLDKRGLIWRAAHDTDRRKQVIHLTEAGANILAAIEPEAQAVYDHIEEEFGRPQMNNLLNKLRKIAAMQDRKL